MTKPTFEQLVYAAKIQAQSIFTYYDIDFKLVDNEVCLSFVIYDAFSKGCDCEIIDWHLVEAFYNAWVEYIKQHNEKTELNDEEYLFPIAYVASKRKVKPLLLMEQWIQQMDSKGLLYYIPMSKNGRNEFYKLIAWWDDKIKSIEEQNNENRSGSFHSVSVSC